MIFSLLGVHVFKHVMAAQHSLFLGISWRQLYEFYKKSFKICNKHWWFRLSFKLCLWKLLHNDSDQLFRINLQIKEYFIDLLGWSWSWCTSRFKNSSSKSSNNVTWKTNILQCHCYLNKYPNNEQHLNQKKKKKNKENGRDCWVKLNLIVADWMSQHHFQVYD